MRGRVLLISFLTLGLLGNAIALTAVPSAFTIGIPPVQRISGHDALDTSIAVSGAAFPQNGSASSVVLARSDYFADALAGGPLAAAGNGPLLITPGAPQSQTLDPRVLSEVQRVLPRGGIVFILGGPLALASGIDNVLRGLGYDVVRVQGPNQFATAVAIAERLGHPPTVFEATGLSFADALSAVPAAIQARGAILLTNGSTQAPETANYLAAHPPATRYAIGGPLAAGGADPLATAIYGHDLFGTSAAVAFRFFSNSTVFGAATGLNFTDALSGGVFMGRPTHLGPVLLVDGSAPLPPSIAFYLLSLTSVTRGYFFGGPVTGGHDVLSALQNPLQPPLSPTPAWLAAVNEYRAAAFLPPVPENPAWSADDAKHAEYMARAGVPGHSQDPNNPYYTPEGNNAAAQSNTAGSSDVNISDRSFVEKWMAAPFHALGILDTRLSSVGYGAFRSSSTPLRAAAALNILSGRNGSTASSVVTFPGNGATVSLTNYGGEVPDALTGCPGYRSPVGLPIIVAFPSTETIMSATLTSFGQPLELCRFDGGSYTNPDPSGQALGRAVLAERNAAVLIPRASFVHGSVYTVSVVTNQRVLTWTFNVR